MPYGGLIPAQLEALTPFIEGQRVWDFGAGDLGHAKTLLQAGAEHVYAVDKEKCRPHEHKGWAITPTTSYYEHLDIPEARFPVAWLSWPTNHHLYGLVPLLSRAETVIYLGSNTGGNACGWPAMFNHFHFREILAYVPHRRNTLTVYGRKLREEERRPLRGEEAAALGGMLMAWDKAEQIANEIAAVVQAG